jgi:proteasome lid subunit RPN8/RPN11
MSTEARCRTCRYFEHFVESMIGQCRRHPPTVLYATRVNPFDSGSVAYWPVTSVDTWCGEYEERDPTVAVGIPWRGRSVYFPSEVD